MSSFQRHVSLQMGKFVTYWLRLIDLHCHCLHPLSDSIGRYKKFCKNIDSDPILKKGRKRLMSWAVFLHTLMDATWAAQNHCNIHLLYLTLFVLAVHAAHLDFVGFSEDYISDMYAYESMLCNLHILRPKCYLFFFFFKCCSGPYCSHLGLTDN